MQKLPIAALLLLFSWHCVLAQTIENVRATVRNEFIIIEYDLRTPIPDQEFNISLFSSTNNFTEALKMVSGDVGPNVKPGINKSISWAAKSELGSYKGQITFEVRGLPLIIARPYTLKSPAAGSKISHGKTLKIEWEGGKPTDEINLQLMQNGVQKGSIAKTSNTGTYNWVVPKSTAKGSYQVILMAAGSTVQSSAFQVKPKTSPIIFILPVALAGGLVFLLMSGDDTGDPGTPGSENLPPAPEPN